MPTNVLIVGGGPAAVEAALALHRLAAAQGALVGGDTGGRDGSGRRRVHVGAPLFHDRSQELVREMGV